MNQWPHNRRQWRPDSFADCFATFAYGICFWFLIFLLRNSEFWCGRSFTVISVSCSFLPHPPLASPRISLLYFLGTFGFNTEEPGDIGSSCSWTRRLHVGRRRGLHVTHGLRAARISRCQMDLQKQHSPHTCPSKDQSDGCLLWQVASFMFLHSKVTAK